MPAPSPQPSPQGNAPAAPVEDYVGMLQNLSPQSPEDAVRIKQAAATLAQHGRGEDAQSLIHAATQMGFHFGPI